MDWLIDNTAEFTVFLVAASLGAVALGCWLACGLIAKRRRR